MEGHRPSIAQSLALALLGFLILVLGIVLALQIRQYVATRNAAIDTAVYRHSAAWVSGKSQQLNQYREAYIMATPVQRQAIKQMVREQYASFPARHLTPALQHFLARMEAH